MSLTKEIVLSAAIEVVRRHGPTKATVVDVAEALGVSHGSIYRFFPTKAALREAVVGNWLNQITDSLEARSFAGSAQDQLRAWFEAFLAVKRTQRDQAPELFEAFRALAAQEPATIAAYKERLGIQIGRILTLGIQTGEFRPVDPQDTARAFLNATLRFHHPVFAHSWNTAFATADFETLWDLLVRSILIPRIAR